jgi:hypothetical protein
MQVISAENQGHWEENAYSFADITIHLQTFVVFTGKIQPECNARRQNAKTQRE